MHVRTAGRGDVVVINAPDIIYLISDEDEEGQWSCRWDAAATSLPELNAGKAVEYVRKGIHDHALMENEIPQGGVSGRAGPSQIKRLRELAGITQTQAAGLLYTSLRSYQQWEAGDRGMHPAFWELFRLKVVIDPREWGLVCVAGRCDSQPAPDEIKRIRQRFGLTQALTAQLLKTSLRSYQQWEAGDRRMHRVFWELFRVKLMMHGAGYDQ